MLYVFRRQPPTSLLHKQESCKQIRFCVPKLELRFWNELEYWPVKGWLFKMHANAIEVVLKPSSVLRAGPICEWNNETG